MAKYFGGKRVVRTAIPAGVALRQLHESVDGWKWLAEHCVPWCLRRPQ
jgi:hypothetical protein